MVDAQISAWRGLVHAYVLDGLGSARRISGQQIQSLSLGANESLWLHWDISCPEAAKWLREQSGLESFACDLLLEENTRPRLLTLPNNQLLVFLRGINLNPGQMLEDMVSIRVFASAQQIISLRLRSAQIAQQIIAQLEQGIGPRTAAELLLGISSSLTDHFDETVEGLSDGFDQLEDLQSAGQRISHPELNVLRRRVAGVRRFLAPVRDVYGQLARLRLDWLDAASTEQFAELNNRLVRHLEDLELLRERAVMVLEAERSRSSERMNHLLYRFAIITVIFLPMSFVTGLLGINVGGIPGADSPWGFIVACALLVVVLLVQLVIYRLLRWI